MKIIFKLFITSFVFVFVKGLTNACLVNTYIKTNVIRLIINYSKRTNKCKKSIGLVTVYTKLTDLQCSERMPGAIQSIRSYVYRT